MKNLLKEFASKAWLFFKKQALFTKVVVVLIATVGLFLFTKSILGGSGEQYHIEPATYRDLVEIVEESGHITISGQVDIFSPTNGVIEEVYVANGDFVQAGQDLFKVQSTATLVEQQAAYSQYLAAKSSLDAAEANLLALQAELFDAWDTFKTLAESEKYQDDQENPREEKRDVAEFLVPEKHWLATEQKYKDQQGVIAQARTAAQTTWLDYQATQTTTVKATANGAVTNLSILPNDSVSAYEPNSLSALNPDATNKPILTIADFTVIGVVVPLGENDVNKVKPGARAEINLDAVLNHTYQGTVTRVDMIGYQAGNIIKYDAFIEIEDTDDQLKAGMTADAYIITQELSDVLSVPNTAIRPHQGGRAVQVVGPDQELEFVPVKVGVRGTTHTEIVSGLEEGQKVVVSLTNPQLQRSSPFGF